MRSKFKWIFTLLLAFSLQISFAQQKTVSGVVQGGGLPMPSVTVQVKGTQRAVQTDLDGKYSIQVSAGESLVFSFIGFKTQTVVVGPSNALNVTLEDDSALLEEVVVVGYGTTTKEAYVGTATKVEAKNIEAKSFSNVTQALKGEVAGVNVITTSGQPGSDATIRIRGFGSINGNRDPLYVLDGVPYNGDLSAINSNDIESMTILKDATATSVYGSRGANGVVLISTKSGKLNTASTIRVDFKTSINTRLLPQYDVISSPEEYIGLSWEAMYNRGVATNQPDPVAFANANLFGGQGINPGYNMWNINNVSELIDPVTRQVRPGVARKYSPENWADFAYQNSYRQEGNVQFSGGSDKTTYAASFGFLDDEGYIVNSNYRRYSTRLALTHKPKDWLKMSSNIGYTGSRYTNNGQSEDSGSVFWFADNIPSIYPLFMRDASGNKIADPYFGGYQYDYGLVYPRGFGGLTNSIADATYNSQRTYQHDFNGSFTADLKLYDGLSFETSYGVQYQDGDINNRENPYYGSSSSPEVFGSLYKTRTRLINQNFLQLLRYRKAFGDHNVEAFVAHESTDWNYTAFTAGKNTAILQDTYDLDQYTRAVGKPSSYTQIRTLESYFGQLSYNYNEKYFITGTARRDGSSRFKEDKWGTFGSVGASWIVTKEKFLDDVKYVNFLKLKASYGVVGDQGSRLMNGYQMWSIGATDAYSFLVSDEQANPAVTWETSKIFQVGFESTFFNNILDVNVDYYVKNTDNLLFSQLLAPSTGFANWFVNDGQLRNSGVEFDVQARLIQPKAEGGLALSLGVNGEFLKNEITKMPIDPATGQEQILNGSYAKGHSIYDYYMREWAGVDPSNGTAMWNMYYNDVNGNGMLDVGDEAITNMQTYLADNPGANIQSTTTNVYADATQKFVGKSSIPKVRGAFRLNAEYKGFDLTTQWTYSIGGYVYDNTYAGLMDNDQVGSNNWHADIRSRWQQPGDITNVPRLSSNADQNVGSVSTRFLTKADYLGLNNIRIGYTIPKRHMERLHIQNLNLYVSGDNLLFFSRRDGLNPSTSESGNSNTYRYSPLSTFTMGVRLDF